jgi:nucleoside-diphosphate-sugar epimerase
VTGASGFIGGRLCERLRGAGWTVIAAVRSPANVVADAILPIADDLASVPWEPVVRDADAVFHLAAHVHVSRSSRSYARETFERVNVTGTIRLADAAARAGVGRFLFLSTAGVHGDLSADRPLREDNPVRPFNFYTASKARAEEELAALGDRLAITVVRPPLVYGAGAPGNFRALMRAVEIGMALPFGAVENVRSLLFVDNLADAMLHGIGRRETEGEAFLLHDIDTSTPELITLVARGMGKNARLIRVPPRWLEALERLPFLAEKLKPLLHSFQIDSGKFRSATGWRPPHDPVAALATVAKCYAEQRW